MELISTLPLVTVLTPVYNGAEFLRECIESVLAQDYQAWEYIIVNNRSTDETLSIAESYAAKDARIRVTTNTEFLSMPQNFNHAFGMVSPRSRYFKVVCADDWIDPRFLSKMVGFAEDHPSVGIVSCHQQSGCQVRWAVLPPSTNVLSGRDACRMVLLQCAAIFPAPTAALYRTSLLAPRATSTCMTWTLAWFTRSWPLSACMRGKSPRGLLISPPAMRLMSKASWSTVRATSVPRSTQRAGMPP
jgi:glycosyltransferase involved in cell wall biosynthesis